MVIFQEGNSQCTHFLGGNKTVVPCSNPFSINYNDLFVTNATFQITVLTPTDTLPSSSGIGDTVIYYMVKTKAVATLPGGCKDSAIVRVVNRRFAIPDVGRDTSLYVCEGVEVNLKPFFNPGFLTPHWNVEIPESVTDSGLFFMTVISGDGCVDTGNITIHHYIKPKLGNDTAVTIRVEDVINVVPFYDTTGLITVWNVPRPDSVKKGIVRIEVTSINGCKDTAFITVNNFPKPDLGPDIKICTTQNVNLVVLFNLTGLTPAWNTGNPFSAGPGTYTLTVTNQFNSRDTCIVTVINNTLNIGSDLAVDKCTSEFLNLASYFNLTGLTTIWNTLDPESVTEPGIYQVYATNAQGCKDTGTIVVNFNPLPPNLRDTVINVCNGNTRDLNNIFDLSAFSNINWSNPTPSAAGAGVDTLTIDDQFGCTLQYTVTLISGSPNKTPLNLCIYDKDHYAFTTNAMRSIAIDIDDNVLVGTDEGGLYAFVPSGLQCGGTWVQSPNFTTNTHKDILAVNTDEICQCSSVDNGIWVASTGNTAAYAIGGGVYHISDNTFTTQRYGSVNDPSGSGVLTSRFANSITIGADNKLYVGLGRSLTTGTNAIMEGGVFTYDLTTNPPNFTQLSGLVISLPEEDIKVSAVGRRGDEVWFGVERSCILNGGCNAPFIIRYNTTTNSQTGAIRFPLPFTEDGGTSIARAIFTDAIGRTYVGLNSGRGFAVLDTNTVDNTNHWILVTSDNSPMPPNTSINFNAITEVNGEIWMGTTNGLLVYDGVGFLNECTSYVLYTTADSLPSNNVTDVAYDISRQNVWIATDNGVCKTQIPTTVVGTVVNVSLGEYNDISAAFLQTPIAGARVSLRDSANLLVDQVITDATGSFSLDNGVPGHKYKVVVEYAGDYRYEFKDLKYNQLLGDVLIPDSLIRELLSFKDTIFEKKYTYGFSIIDSLGVITAKGYDTTNFYKSYISFADTVTDLHRKRVEDLGIFYLALATMYNAGNNSNKLFNELVTITIDAVKLVFGAFKALKKEHDELDEFQELVKNDKKPDPPIADNFALTDIQKAQIGAIKVVIDAVQLVYEKVVVLVPDDTLKQYLDVGYKVISKTKDWVINAIEDGLESNFGEIIDGIIDDIVKVLVLETNKLQYERFCNDRHPQFVKKMAEESYLHSNILTYAQSYKKLYSLSFAGSPSKNSLNKRCNDSTQIFLDKIAFLKELSELADGIAGWADKLKELALASVIGAELAPIFEGISIIMSTLKVGAMAGSLKYAYDGYNQIDDLSDFIGTTSGFPNVRLITNTQPTRQAGRNNSNLNTLPVLENQKTLFNQRLIEFKTVINSPYDSLQFSNKFNALLLQNGKYISELNKNLRLLWPVAKTVSKTVAGFKEDIDIVIDSIVTNQKTITHALFLQINAYMLDTLKTRRVAFLNTLINKLISLNDGSVAGISDLINQISSAGNMPEKGYIEKSDYKQYFDHQHGSTGKAVYTFVNNGNIAFNKSYIKFMQPTGGFSLASVDSIYIGSIQPGEIKTVQLLFTAPVKDTIGNINCTLFSDSLVILNVSNIQFTKKVEIPYEVYSVKNGAWSDPSTWNIKAVPLFNSNVTVKHNVDVDITTATCNSISIKSPGLLRLLSNKKIYIK